MLSTLIPDHAASRSKMSQKGWKCWAMRVTSVKSGAMPFDGDRLTPGTSVMLEAGDVVIHIDQSSRCTLYTVVPNIDGTEGRLPDMAVATNPEGLAGAARNLLAAAPSQRIAMGAKQFLLEAFVEPDTNDEERASRRHYESLAANAGSAEEIDLSAVSTSALMAELARRGAVPA
jgi:hypothetical protein